MLVRCPVCGVLVDPEQQGKCPKCGAPVGLFRPRVADADDKWFLGEDDLFIGKLKMHINESGYANIALNRPLDTTYIKQFFQGMDIYAEAKQASILVKKNANVFLYAEPNNTQRIVFGPVVDEEVMVLVSKYMRSVMTKPDTVGTHSMPESHAPAGKPAESPRSQESDQRGAGVAPFQRVPPPIEPPAGVANEPDYEVQGGRWVERKKRANRKMSAE